MEKDFNSSDLFEKLRESVLKMDPIYFCEKYWPDFGENDLDAALAEYASRQRRFGR